MYHQGLVVRSAKLITPHDSNDQGLGDDGQASQTGSPSSGLYVGTTGNLAVILEGMTAAITFTSVPVGWHPLRVKRVMATNTTAANIAAVWG